MTSPYLERPIRPRHVVIADLLANMRDTWIVVSLSKGEPYLHETELGQSFDTVVKDILDGQYDDAVAVIRLSRLEPAENVTEKVADAVLTRIVNDQWLTYDDGYLIERPFLDNVMPDWIERLPHGPGRQDRDYEPDEAA